VFPPFADLTPKIHTLRLQIRRPQPPVSARRFLFSTLADTWGNTATSTRTVIIEPISPTTPAQ
jgi:hypothetical protein